MKKILIGLGLLYFSILGRAEFEEVIVDSEVKSFDASSQDSSNLLEVQSTTGATELTPQQTRSLENKKTSSKQENLTPRNIVEKELDRRYKLLYPEKEFNKAMQLLCRENPKNKEILSEDQLKFYCKTHGDFRNCFSKDVLYNFDINRQQKITMAKSCIEETATAEDRFDDNSDQLHDLTTIEDFENVFTQLILPEPEQDTPPSPSLSEAPAIYEMGARERRDKSSYALNNKQQDVRDLEYVEKAFDIVNDHSLEMKTTPKDIPKQYPLVFESELDLLDKLPEETNDQGQKVVYQFPREHCLSRPLPASECRYLIKEMQRRRQAKARYSRPINPDRVIYRDGAVSQ